MHFFLVFYIVYLFLALKPEDWSKYNLHTIEFSEEDYFSNIDVIYHPANDLVNEFKSKGWPMLIKNVVTTWPAYHEWTLEVGLYMNLVFLTLEFRNCTKSTPTNISKLEKTMMEDL